MKKLAPVTKGPPGLVKCLNTIIGWCNSLDLVDGRGIHITPTAKGWIINAGEKPAPSTDSTDPADAPSPDAGGGGGAGAGGSWLTIDVMDASCNRTTIQVWSKPAGS